MTDTDPTKFPKKLQLKRHSSHVEFPARTITVDDEEREWQCIECGHVAGTRNRPGICPHCNTTDGDLDGFLRVMIPREACGWYE